MDKVRIFFTVDWDSYPKYEEKKQQTVEVESVGGWAVAVRDKDEKYK